MACATSSGVNGLVWFTSRPHIEPRSPPEPYHLKHRQIPSLREPSQSLRYRPRGRILVACDRIAVGLPLAADRPTAPIGASRQVELLPSHLSPWNYVSVLRSNELGLVAHELSALCISGHPIRSRPRSETGSLAAPYVSLGT